MNEGDHKKENQSVPEEGDPYSIIQRYVSDVSNVFSSTRIRRIIQINDGNNWFILGSRCNLLLNFRIFLVILYFTIQIFN